MLVADLTAPELTDDDAHHLASVLRLRPGEAVGVTDGRGGWRLCAYRGERGTRPSIEVVGEAVTTERPHPPISIGLAPVKGDRTEWAVQKLTELGVDRIVVLRTDRGVVRWDADRAQSHLTRLEKVARQALMQSRGLWLPELSGPIDVEQARTNALIGAVAMAEPGGSPPSLAQPTVLVGPEGGWSPEELRFGLARVSLGPTVLRTESAAVAAAVLLTALRHGIVASAPG